MKTKHENLMHKVLHIIERTIAVITLIILLGMLGYDEKAATGLLRTVREGHGALDCATLLRTSHEAGIPRKQHCDGIVFELLQIVEDIVKG